MSHCRLLPACCLLLLAACSEDSGATESGAGVGSTSTSSGIGATSGGTQVDAESSATSSSATSSVETSGASSSSSDGSEGSTTTGATTELAPKSLVIAIDGLRPDALTAANTPNLDGLLLGGWQPDYGSAYTPEATALTDANTLSGPNHWAIMTGANGTQHGVTSNGDVAEGDAENFPHYLSQLEAADSELNTAYLFTWGPDGLIPCEADLVLDADDASNASRVAEILSGAFLAETWPRGTDADAAFIFLDDVDGAGHGSGFDPEGANYIAAIEEVDAQVGIMLDALLARETLATEDWQVVVTSDHGGIGMNHGGMSPEELTIPFGVTSRSTRTASLPSAQEDGTGNTDVVPTVLEHFGLRPAAELTGQAR